MLGAGGRDSDAEMPGAALGDGEAQQAAQAGLRTDALGTSSWQLAEGEDGAGLGGGGRGEGRRGSTGRRKGGR